MYQFCNTPQTQNVQKEEEKRDVYATAGKLEISNISVAKHSSEMRQKIMNKIAVITIETDHRGSMTHHRIIYLKMQIVFATVPLNRN